jgi:tetratricopeptide (TPR) repeat protein
LRFKRKWVLVAILFFWWVYLRRAFLFARDPKGIRRDWALGLFGVGVALLVNAQVNFPWRVLATHQLCWLAWAILAIGPDILDEPLAEVAAEPPAQPTPPLALGMGLVLVVILALYPTRWFYASNLFKQGNARKDAQQAQAIGFYEKAVKVGLSGTQEVELYLYLGSMYNVANRSDDAIVAFRRGLEAYPDFLEALYNLGFTYQSRYNTTHAAADLAEAKRYYLQLLDINPRYLSGLNNLGNLYYLEKDFPKAIEVYTKLARFGPQLVEGHYNLGATYLMLGDVDHALAAFETALKVKPDYAAAKTYAEQLRRLPKGSKINVNGKR